MRRLIFCFVTLLGLAAGADELPFTIKGVFQGKVGDKTFEQPFEAKINPNDKNDVRVEMDGYDLVLGVRPHWHYTAGLAPDGILLDLYLRCWGNGLKIQRYAGLLATPAKQMNVDMHDKDAPNVFSVEVQAQPVGAAAPPPPAAEPAPAPPAPAPPVAEPAPEQPAPVEPAPGETPPPPGN